MTPRLRALMLDGGKHLCRCAYRKLDPAIAMMKATENRLRSEVAETLDRPMARRILVQEKVRSQFVVVAGVGCKDPAQMGLAEDDDVIEAFPVDRADQSLRMTRSAIAPTRAR